ncbi:SRPBCC family protein [Deinococcus sp.]|uniref:SRPBCC family protein n=1 Tax=Deinococcus sp. TaxID=47478 RepID=UPI0025CF5FCD|nr:SRPBCC family protein [Deinococcus sp.]
MTTQTASATSFLQTAQGGHLQPTERVLVGVLGLGLALLGLGGGRARGLILGGAGLGLAAVALRGSNPLATALKIQQNEAGETLVSDAVTIGKAPDELYALWRPLERLPQIMSHLKDVQVLSETRSHWTVKGPLGNVSWDAEITADEPGRRLAWASLPGAGIENSGEVIFREAPGGRGTELVVRLKYKNPAGTAGAVIARIAGQEPSQQLRDDLMRFKREQELGFNPTTEGQTSGRNKSQTINEKIRNVS